MPSRTAETAALRASSPGGGRGLKLVFAAVLGAYAVASLIGLANARYGW